MGEGEATSSSFCLLSRRSSSAVLSVDAAFCLLMMLCTCSCSVGLAADAEAEEEADVAAAAEGEGEEEEAAGRSGEADEASAEAICGVGTMLYVGNAESLESMGGVTMGGGVVIGVTVPATNNATVRSAQQS
jgi:hypothetical protein